MIKAQCQDLFSEVASKAPSSIDNPLFTISSILMVGALFQDPQHQKLDEDDELALKLVVKEMVSIGVVFKAPEVSVCNLRYDAEHDFIRQKTYADLLMLCFINKSTLWPTKGLRFDLESDLLRQGHTWRESIEDSRSPFVAVNGIGATCLEYTDIPESYQEIETPNDLYDMPIFKRRGLELLG